VSKYAMFEVYLANNWSDVKAGKEITCELFCFDDASIHLVKAIIAKKPDSLPDGEELMVRNDEGQYIKDNPWAIKVIEELDPDEVDFAPSPSTIKPIY
jgi:hypothetical protein